MNNTLYPAPLYTFLSLCQREALPKEVLDCGAGGANPPLNLFCSYGYRAAGVEIDPQRAQLAREAARQHGVAVDIREVDMRRLPFAEQSFSFVYSYNSVFHLSKADIATAIAEMRRVLRRGGELLFAEHGTARSVRAQRWQHRIEPVWTPLAGGCHLTRDPPRILREAGFTVEWTEGLLDPRPLAARTIGPLTYGYWGVAR